MRGAKPSEKIATSSSPEQMFRLDGRVTLLTGATGHLGRPMAHALAAAGAVVLLSARSASAVEYLKEELRGSKFEAHAFPMDIKDDKRLRAAFRKIEKQFGMLDVVVNNAYAGLPGTIDSATAEDFEDAYSVTVTAAFRIVQLARPLFARSRAVMAGGASVINIASMYGTVSPDPRIYGNSGSNNPPYYGPAKAGAIQLTRYLACHLAGERIRVNSISPGPFPASARGTPSREFVAELNRKVPMGRVGRPVELVGPLLFLASDASSYVTGSNLAVDGGWTAW